MLRCPLVHATEFVESYFAAWNHHDPKAVAEHLANDGIYCDIPENAQRTRDELIVSLNDFFSEHRQRYELIGDIMTGRNSIAFQYRICPLGKIVEGEYAGPFRGAEFISLHGDAAMTITDYYDMPGVARPAHLAALTSRNGRAPKYAKSGLSGEQLLAYKDRLERFMLSEQAYLRSDLTLPRLAKEIDCSVNHLSQVINSGFGVSFFDYLNRFRIEHAKGLLSSVDGHNGAILNIAFTVGFNSNSAFYAAFKKCVGQTPAQFRQSQLKKRH
jgi:AraC-like DNA-binding protein